MLTPTLPEGATSAPSSTTPTPTGEAATIPSFGSVAFSFGEQATTQRKSVTVPKGRMASTAAARSRNPGEEIQVGMWYKVFKDLSSLQKKDWNAAMDKTIGHTGLVKAINPTANTVHTRVCVQ
jgi:hypothetical protein